VDIKPQPTKWGGWTFADRKAYRIHLGRLTAAGVPPSRGGG
jgi:hypothetical protein